MPEAIEYMKHLVEFKPVFIEGIPRLNPTYQSCVIDIL